MRAWGVLFLVLAVTACGRPLTGNESELASRLFGADLNTARVRLGATGLIGLRTSHFPARPRTSCRERLVPPPEGAWQTGRTAGVVLGNRVMVRANLMRGDFARLPDGTMALGVAMFLAHELTHVWQWQNRALTGYSPWRVSTEHRSGHDPYLFDTRSNAGFLDFGYEQQASLVEEYVCCAALDPQGARTRRLHELLAQVMPVAAVPDWPVRIPWQGAQTRGICT